MIFKEEGYNTVDHARPHAGMSTSGMKYLGRSEWRSTDLTDPVNAQ